MLSFFNLYLRVSHRDAFQAQLFLKASVFNGYHSGMQEGEAI